MMKDRITLTLSNAARARVENAPPDKTKPLQQMCNRSVFEKSTGRFLGCVLGQVHKEEGKYPTKGDVGFIYIDLNVHTTRPATDKELSEVFMLNFYETVKDAPGVSIARYHDEAHAKALEQKWLEKKK